MVSAAKVMGYLLQISGMLIMFFAFFQLSTSFQSTFSMVISAMQATEPVQDTRPICETGQVSNECRVDFSSGNAIEDFFQPLVQQYIYLVVLGIGLVFAGLILRSISEISGKFGRGPKMPQKEKIRFGQEYM